METCISTKRYVELVTERTVERFLLRLFLREARVRGLYIVSPYIAPLSEARYTLTDLRHKVECERIPTYIMTREPTERYQEEALAIVRGCAWIEIRYNSSLHAKLYLASTERQTDSFALFGSGNLTARSIESNIELGMLVYSEGPGAEILGELQYWASVRLRTLRESRLIQSIHAKRS